MDKDKLIKLLDLVTELSHIPGNEWYKNKLTARFSKDDSTRVCNHQLDEIYELCINKIVEKQAFNFYNGFKLLEIKEKLISDFVRMEKFRRQNNFEDFCLAAFQQIEAIVNRLSTNELQELIVSNQMINTHKIKDETTGKYEPRKLWQLIFFPNLSEIELEKKLRKEMIEWDFSEKYKAILFFYFFNQKIFNYYDFKEVYFLGNELYQLRNQNHRGGRVSPRQQVIVDKVKFESYKYYFKFLGYIEEFVGKVNQFS